MERYALVTCHFDFEASHQLRRDDWSDAENDRVYGNCVRLHGHSYRLFVTLRGPIDPATGMVINFRDVKDEVRVRILDRLDHRHLNDVVPGITTAENLLYWIAEALLPAFGVMIQRLELWETATSGAVLTNEEIIPLLQQRSTISVA